VQAASVVVPTPLHYSIAKDLLEHDIHVLLEKPMTTTVEEGSKLIALAHKHNLVLQIGHLERFNPAYLAVEQTVKDPLFIESHRLNSFQERGTEVDVILDIMIHDIDIILNLVDDEVKRIHAVGIPVISSMIDIAKHDAYISIDFAAQGVSVYKKIEEDGKLPYIVSEQLKIEPGDSLEEEIKSFLTAVRTNRKPSVPGEAGIRALKVALEITNQLKRTTQSIVG
jgi:predicted dehydrogenase